MSLTRISEESPLGYRPSMLTEISAEDKRHSNILQQSLLKLRNWLARYHFLNRQVLSCVNEHFRITNNRSKQRSTLSDNDICSIMKLATSDLQSDTDKTFQHSQTQPSR